MRVTNPQVLLAECLDKWNCSCPLGIDRFADQAQAVELSLRRLRTWLRLVHFGRSQQFHRAIVCKIALKSYIIVGPISKQPLEVMGNRVQQFHHGLVVVAVGWGEQEAQEESAPTDPI